MQFFLVQSLLQRQRDEEEAAQRLVKKAEEAKEKEERKAKFEDKMLVVNRRVRDGTATPAEEAAWRRWMGPRAWLLLVLQWKEEEEEEKEEEEAPQVLFWCAVPTLWAIAPLSLFFFWVRTVPFC